MLWVALAGCGGSGTGGGAGVQNIVTESGPLRGITKGQVDEFLGIPYAAPPVCGEIPFKRRPGFERGRCSVCASGMSQGLQLDAEERHCAELG